MPLEKKVMLQARLSKRMRKLGLQTFEEYYNFVFSQHGNKDELQNMIDAVTTNKTDFYREPKHFDYLIEKVLPEYISSGNKKKLMAWSAGCSTGAEPYTIAMVLSNFAEKYTKFDFSILATDLSSQVLKEAALGIYRESDVAPVPLETKKKYLLRSINRNEKRVRIIPDLRYRIEFRQLNFMNEEYGIRKTRDIIFCRNVIIYFSRSTQEAVLNRLCRHLKKDGYMFMGHSETLNGLDVPLVQIAPNIYKKI